MFKRKSVPAPTLVLLSCGLNIPLKKSTFKITKQKSIGKKIIAWIKDFLFN